MCLHAHSLRLRLAPRDTAYSKGVPSQDNGDEAVAVGSAEAATPIAVDREQKRAALKRKGRPAGRAGRGGAGGADGGREETVFKIVAPDPFVFVDGELQL